MANPRFTAHVVVRTIPAKASASTTSAASLDFEIVRNCMDVNTPLYDAAEDQDAVGDAAVELLADPEIQKHLKPEDFVIVSLAGELNFGSFTSFEGDAEYYMEVEPHWHFWRTLSEAEAKEVIRQEYGEQVEGQEFAYLD